MARSKFAAPTLTLDRYREIMNIPPWLFNGVDNPNEVASGCDHCWSQWERGMVAQSILDAEETLALHLGFYLGEKYLTDQDHEWTDPIQLRYGHIVGGGVEARTDVSATVSASDFTTDPATITLPSAGFPGGTSEVEILETSSGLEIYPSAIATSGTNYVISIPQYNLIEWDDLDGQTTATCIEWDAAFPAAIWLKLADLTINRQYLDTTDQAEIEFGPYCNCWYCGTACVGTTYDGCVYVIDEEISKVRVQLSTYDAVTGTWSCNYPVLNGCYKGDKATVSYLAGTTDVPGWERAVRSLAHTYMLIEPCGCTMFKMAVGRDLRINPLLTAERINNPLGMMNGAWAAWQWLVNNRQGEAVML